MSARFTPQRVWDMYRAMPAQDMYDYSPYLRGIAHGNVLEIGVRDGVSTAAFLLGFDDKDDGHLWSVDVDARCGTLYDHPRWTFVHGNSRDVALPDIKFDVVLVDGDHGYEAALGDFERFGGMLVPGGTLLAHDVEPTVEPHISYLGDATRRAWLAFTVARPSWPSRTLPPARASGWRCAVHSFDFWDTLVARRTMRDEIHFGTREGKSFEDAASFEYNNLIPIAENVAKVKPDDIVVSDYGDGSEKWHTFLVDALRRRCSLENAIYVTPGGKHDRSVWATLPERPKTHTGDNRRSDVDSPEDNGIRGLLSVRSPFTNPEAFVNDHGFPALARVMREARLRLWDPAHRGIEIMQADYNFPTLFCASVMLNRRYPTSALLMSGRDCYMWQRLMQRMFGRGAYFETSCKLRKNATPAYHRYIRSFGDDPVLVDISGSGKSFSHLPEYPSVLMFKPLRNNETNGVPALWQCEDVWRLEQANRAPLKKCIGMADDLTPIYLESGIDTEHEPHIAAQCNAFFTATDCMRHYDMAEEMKASDDACRTVMAEMLPHYVDFKDDVEALRQIDIAEDRL